jgi:hypothetical protein
MKISLRILYLILSMHCISEHHLWRMKQNTKEKAWNIVDIGYVCLYNEAREELELTLCI